ncbi:hypothetical protein SAMN05443665_105024 [Actinomadura meyerae]|uniref:Thioesterase-like superfamily protein n=1 Tax=Actinomadura meyerae TaxID=240840 RepID=A0A239NW75_9ACTN|nr:hypothetical protein [Actinomadura meyerae]SNT58614.1 hypothetical protein SAMN05443665_105024 [Actinomadura meyerae]
MTETTGTGGGTLAGEARRPRNLHLTASGSIHDDATAQRLGFRGGTIAGSYHMEQAVPLVLRLFGREWFESGTMAAYFRRATVDGEAVRAFARPPAAEAGRAELWMDTAEGQRVWEGSATAGNPRGRSGLADRMTDRGADEVRILSSLQVGEVIDLGELRLDGERQRDRLRRDLVTEPLDWYAESSPWGPAVASPPTEVWFTFESVKKAIAERRGAGVGLYGAIEIRHLTGPLLLDETYHVSSTVRALGCTPKTEYMWTETVASRRGTPVASVLMMSRVMKASSDLYS